jgi:hypothetical protein
MCRACEREVEAMARRNLQSVPQVSPARTAVNYAAQAAAVLAIVSNRSPLFDSKDLPNVSRTLLFAQVRQELVRSLAMARGADQPTFFQLAMECLNELERNEGLPPDHDCLLVALAESDPT